MDVVYPYAGAPARLQLLYCLPTAPEPQRLIIVRSGVGPDLPEEDWPGPVRQVNLDDLRTPPADASLKADALALPGVLGQRAAMDQFGNNVDLLVAASRWVVPGGLVIGHVAQLRALRRVMRPGGLVALGDGQFRRGAITGPAQCLQVLGAAGLRAAQCFYVQPSIDEPMGLVPVHAATARAHFLRAVRSAAPNQSAVGHGVRLALVLAGLGGLMQEHLFFWAEATC